MISKEQLDELERLEREATEGPWHEYGRGSGIDREYEVRTHTGGIMFRSTSYGHMERDARLIAAARNAMPDLLQTIKEQREVIEKLEGALRCVLEIVHDELCSDKGHAVGCDIASDALTALAKSRAGDGGGV